MRYTHDSAGRRIAETSGSGTATSTISYSYDSNNNLIKVTDGNGAISRNAYDANNRLVFQISARGNVVEQSYDAENCITAVRRYARALAPEQLERATDPAAIRSFVISTSDDQLEYRVYDKSGHITHRISGLGAVTAMTYDANGNVLSQRRYANLIDVKKLGAGQAPQVDEDNAADGHAKSL